MCLNDCRSVHLTSIIRKCFKRLVMIHINVSFSGILDPLIHLRLQQVHGTCHIPGPKFLQHLDNKDIYIQLLFTEYNSTFITMIPTNLISNFLDLGISSPLYNWIVFPTHRTQSVRKGDNVSSTIILCKKLQRVVI